LRFLFAIGTYYIMHLSVWSSITVISITVSSIAHVYHIYFLYFDSDYQEVR
jgi:hypothetical protein